MPDEKVNFLGIDILYPRNKDSLADYNFIGYMTKCSILLVNTRAHYLPHT